MEFGVEFISSLIFTLFFILLALIYRHVSKLYTYFDKLEIPSPPTSFLFGTLKEAPGKFWGDIDISNVKLYGKVYGTFDGLTPNFMVIEPNIIKQILLTQADKFTDRRVAGCQNPILKKSLSYLYGEVEKEMGALTNTLLSDSKIKKLIPRLESSANCLLRNVLRIKDEGVRVNFISVMNEYIPDVVAFTIFGTELNSDASFKDEFVSYCDQIFKVKNPNSILALIPFMCESLQRDSSILPQRALDYFSNLVTRGIKETPREPVLTDGKAANLIELLIEASEEEKKLMKGEKEVDGDDLILTEECIVAKCISSILALFHTTQSIVLLAIHSLANHKELQETLSAEVKKNKSEKLSIADLENLHLLDMVILEVLRLYPSEFRVEKRCVESTTIDNLKFEKGVNVSIPLFALHRHQDNYTEPEKFDPSRFSEEEVKNRNPFIYLPFGQAGVNSCSIGLRLALLASKVTLFKLVQKFRFTAGDESNNVVYKKGVTIVPKIHTINVETELRE